MKQMSQQFVKHKFNMSEKNANYSSEDQSESNKSEQYQNFYSLRSQAAFLLEQNLNLHYNHHILESELSKLKRKQAQKDHEIKKWKEKLKNKGEKQSELKKHLEQTQKGKNKKLLTGYNNLSIELEEMKRKEKRTRSLRINAQDEKNNLYERLTDLQDKYKQVICHLQELHGIEESLNQVEKQNKSLGQRVEYIEKQINFSQDKEKHGKQKTTRQKVKDLNSRVKELQKEEESFEKQIFNLQCQHHEQKSDEKNYYEKKAQIQQLKRKIQDIRTSVLAKKQEYTNVDAMYKQLSIEETKIRKQMILQKECLQEQKKYKEATNKKESNKFQVIDSETDLINSRKFKNSPKKGKQQSDPELQKIYQQYDRLHHKMKNRN